MIQNAEYRVNLEVFEGPLDLLLYLIKKNDLDVYDIPIAFVLEAYMKHVDSLRELNIDLAGEFLHMAAELAYIKSRMLLPDDFIGEEEEEEADPRADLVRRLLEYQQFREAAEKISGQHQLHRDVFVPLRKEKIESDTDGPIEATMSDLISAFSQVLSRMHVDDAHLVAIDRISVNERIYELIERIKQGETVSLDELLVAPIHRYHVVVTFLALLEMCRLRIVKMTQSERCGPLYLTGLMEPVKDREEFGVIYGGEMKKEDGNGTDDAPINS